MPLEFTASHVQDSLALLRQYKTMAEKAMAQLTDDQLNAALDPEMNSVALIVKHMAGNMRSRWTDFLTTDGEKPGRNRDSEFEAAPTSRDELMALWEEGWHICFAAIEPLTEADLARPVFIRGEKHSVLQAINRQLAHYACHIGQIVFLAKHLNHTGWQSLSIPRGQSSACNRSVASGEIAQR
ncbi:MAG: DUF1572 domain-containing protein [Bryobacter sp.]|nr:DUF1572 domain-containing protein [Bryobacter sp.]